MKTEVCKMLGLELPVFAFTHCRDVVVEVSRAGGMGVLGAVGFTPEQLREELAWIDEHIQGKPYGVDILIPGRTETSSPDAPSRANQPHSLEDLLARIPQQHRQFMEDYCIKNNIPELPSDLAAALLNAEYGRINMSPTSSASLVDVALEFPVSLVVNALGTPAKEQVDKLHARGIKVASLVGKTEHAIAQVAAGVDIIVAQGSEAGGHTGNISSMVLWPQVVDAVAPVPVLAAGGIGRGRQMAAALALGAEGIWCGSIWLGTEQSELGTAMKERLFTAKSEDAIQSRALSGKPCRMLRSGFSDAWAQPGTLPPLPMPLQTLLTLEARLRIERAEVTEHMGYPVGQIVGDMQQESSVKTVIYDLLNEFLESTHRINQLLESE
ncbi:MAG: monooxygenase [Cellvibrionaceae bacterium]|nr:monooxygenase [Cellvibrionaceae bacterium]|tara:strand:- start:62290 stop:63435 length:1146 start_codon:yes stop_codon:yes gene_type:complete